MDQTSKSEKDYQRQKYDEIIELLLSAGYHRARINNLSEFDKVVGGLCWCITSSGEDVDVDILFQENSTIGQRITLSEAVVKALRKMKCPAPIEPHQIQGGVGGTDCPALFPVIVWLVKKFFERREVREAQLRSFSVMQFSKNYQLPTDPELHSVCDDLSDILKRNRAVRQFRRRETKQESEETRVHSCLMEYGELFGIRGEGKGGKGKGNASDVSNADMIAIESAESSGKTVIRLTVSDTADVANPTAEEGAGGAVVGRPSSMRQDTANLSVFDKKLAKAQKEALKEEEAAAESATREEAELMKEMSQVQQVRGDTVDGEEEEALIFVSGSQVGAMMQEMGATSEIGSAAAAYEVEVENQRKGVEEGLGSRIAADGTGSAPASGVSGGKNVGSAALFKRQKQAVLKQQQEITVKGLDLQAQLDVMTEKLHLLEEEREKTIEYNESLKEMVKKQEVLEKGAGQQKELLMLKDLVSLNESLKGQEATFKGSCKQQLQVLTAQIKEIESQDSAENADEIRKWNDIEEMHSKVMAKYTRLRQMLAAVNLEVATTSRFIDDIPTRTELIQYERRFGELYQQVSWKLEETRKYYALYNTLETTLSFLQKEVKLLNSISENFDDAMVNQETKQQYLSQIAGIVRGVEDSLERQESNLQLRDQRVEQLKSTHQNLVDEQRKYFKAVKDFQDECNKNEWLTSKLDEMK